MLKALFIDLVPYIIDEQKLFKSAWKETLSARHVDLLEQPPVLEMMTHDLNVVEQQTKLMSFINDEQEVHSLIEAYAQNLLKLTQALFTNFKLLENVAKLLDDAERSQCTVIIMSSHIEYLFKLKQLNFFSKNVTFLQTPEKVSITAEDLFKYASEHNVGVAEFLCLTQETNTLTDMLKNGYFCATINKSESTNSNLYIINSLADLDFESIRYNFYESVGDESEDL